MGQSQDGFVTTQWDDEHRYCALMAQATDGSAIYDQQGRIVAANLRVCEMLGLTLNDIGASDDSARTPSRVDTLSKGQTLVSDRLLRRKDGSAIRCEIRARLIEEGGPEAFVLDITEHKLAEGALQATENEFRTFVECLTDGLLITDLNNVVLYTNQRMAELCGYTIDELVGATAYELILSPDKWPALQKRHEARGVGDAEQYELEIIHKGGAPVWVQVSATPLRDASGQITRTMSAIADITERKHTEEALRRRNDELAFLHETTLGLINRLDVNSLLEAILARAVTLMGAEHGYIYIVEPGDDEIVIKIGMGMFADRIGFRMRRGQGLSGRVWESGEPSGVDSYNAWPDKQSGFGSLQAVAAIPLRSGDKVNGVLGVAYTEEHRKFGPEESSLLGSFGQLASLALENARLFADAQGELGERKKGEEALRASESRFRAVFESAIDAIFVIDNDGLIVDVNPAACELCRGTREELLQTIIDELVPVNRRDETRRFSQIFRSRGALRGEFQLLRGDGCVTDVEFTSTANFMQGYHLVVVSDIAEQKTLREQLAHQAYHDALTNLPNRTLFMDRLSQALARGARHDTQTAVIFLDLDDFKVINDSLGHKAGDTLLVEAGQRLQSCVRNGDTVARLGGDEFTALLEDVRLTEATATAERIAEKLAAPFYLEGCEVFVTTSIGIAISEPGQDSPDDLLRNADVAMYEAKNKGKDRYKVFHPVMNARAWERLQMEIDLRRALERDELTVYYQLVVNLATEKPAEVEALVRWMHPHRGLVSPADFIPVAEETGLILPIGQWVLEQACRQVKQWQESSPSNQPLVVSVNLSLKQFKHPRLAADIRRTLHESGLDPRHLKLEITESAAMEDAEQTIATLHELKSLGIQLAIDDFGTGYSALSYLKRFPVDTLKLDQSFVEGLGHDAQNTAIVQAILAFAKALNLTVTAEGIETPEQLEHLRALECDCGQGYHFAHPMPAAALSLRFMSTQSTKIGTGPLQMDKVAV